jgi:hypothetical protein
MKQSEIEEKMPAHNKRFGEIGGEVITRNFAASFNRWCQSELCAVDPQLRQAAGTLGASVRTHNGGKQEKKRCLT